MKKKLLSLCFTAALVVALAAPAAASPDIVYAASFSDIGGHWAKDYIESAVKKGFVNGYPDGTFRPEKAVTRAEFTSMVNKAFGNSQTASLNFSDVPYAEWYYNDVSKAVAATYVAGYEDNTFKPDSPITRQEAAVMISRLIPAYGYSGNLKSYGDYSSIGEWAYTAMQKVNGKGYIGAYDDGRIHPLDRLTRAQTAKIICDITDKETIVTSMTTIKKDDTKLSGKIYSNGVTLHKDLDDGDATIDNCIILGTLTVQGGGANTVTVSNSRVASCLVNKSSDSVRVLARGEVVISNATVNNTAILESSNLTGGLYGAGFSSVNTNSSADVTLKGSFPKVNVLGSRGNVKAESATITTLNVESSGKNSDITLDSRSSITTANVSGVSYFHGTGTINKMNAKVSGITYETKPRDWSLSSGVKAPTYADPDLDISFDPKNGETNVNVNVKPTITFNTAVTKYNGKTINNDDLTDMIELRKKTSSGTRVGFSASINSAKKIITITPDDDLDDDTKYYILIDKNTFLDADDEGNDAQSVYFTTGDGTDEDGVSFSPRSGETDVRSSVDPTISFDSAIETSGNDDVTKSYLNNNLIFKKNSSSGTNVDFSASINSSDKVITITPDDYLDDGKYYIGFKANKFKYKSSGKAIPAKGITFTVGEGAELYNVSVSGNTSSIVLNFKASERGTVYAMAVPYNDVDKTPTTDLIRSGKYYYTSSKTKSATRAGSRSVSADSSSSISLNASYSSGTRYTVYAYLAGSSNGDSSVVSKTITVNAPENTLRSLSVNKGTLSPSFTAATKSYTVALAGPQDVTINAAALYSTPTINGVSGTSRTINIQTTTKVEVKTSSYSNYQGTTYTITFNMSTPTAELTGLTVSPDTGSSKSLTVADSMTASVPYETQSFTISAATASGDKATIYQGSSGSVSSLYVGNFAGSSAEFTIEVTAPNKTSKSYKLIVNRDKGDVSLSGVYVNRTRVSGSGSDYTASIERETATQEVSYEFKAANGSFSGDAADGTLIFGPDDESKTVRVTLSYGGNSATYTLTITMDKFTSNDPTGAAILPSGPQTPQQP